MENIPNKIYLQIGEDADITTDNSINDFNDLYRGAITWNDERINENDIEYERRHDADLKNAALPIFDVSKMLPDDEQIGKIVHKIAYTQQGEEQEEDFVQKVWILKNFIEKQFNAEYDV